MKNKLGTAVAVSVLVSGFLIGLPAFAQSTTSHGWQGPMRQPGVFGTVSSISGNIITLASKSFGPSKTSSTSTYSVDASNATVIKNGATSTLSSISTGDMLMVQGTVSGTSVAATTIRDGMMMRSGMGGKAPAKPQTPLIQGNGQPVIGGNVSAVNGSTLTVTNKSSVTYTVDASSATVVKGNETSSLSSVAVGDAVVIQGAVNGSAVTASSVLDQGAPKTPGTSTTGTTASVQTKIGGFFGGIGGFFKGLFGFF